MLEFVLDFKSANRLILDKLNKTASSESDKSNEDFFAENRSQMAELDTNSRPEANERQTGTDYSKRLEEDENSRM